MKALNWIIALVGLWEFGDIALPFVIGFGNVQIFVWDHILVGLILMVAGVRAGLARDVRTVRAMDWIAAFAGGWLILGTFLWTPPVIAAGRWNDIIAGAISFILGVWSALASPREAG